jgi:hypothetical protein
MSSKAICATESLIKLRTYLYSSANYCADQTDGREMGAVYGIYGIKKKNVEDFGE